jgi:hypothetical protein
MRWNDINRLLLLEMISINRCMLRQNIPLFAFVFEKEGRKSKRLTFNYTFTKGEFGIFSKELEEDIDYLIKNGYLEKDREIFATRKGKEKREDIQNYGNRKNLTQFITYYIALYGDWSYFDFKEKVDRWYFLKKERIDVVLMARDDTYKIGICHENEDEKKEAIQNRYGELLEKEKTILEKLEQLTNK